MHSQLEGNNVASPPDADQCRDAWLPAIACTYEVCVTACLLQQLQGRTGQSRVRQGRGEQGRLTVLTYLKLPV